MKCIQQMPMKLIIAGTVLLHPFFGEAQQQDSVESKNLIPIEIRAIRVNNKAPYAFSNIDSLSIRKANGIQDVPYLLNQTPSVVISSDAGNGVGYSSMRIRGTDASRINFTMNGIPINDAESQGAFFVDFPDILSSTNSIQIQRGVGTSTNGSGAFGASVNMSNIKQGLKPYASIHSAIGSFNTFKNSIRLGSGRLSNGFQFDLRLSKINSDGYIERSYSDLKSLQFVGSWTSKNEKTAIKFNLLTGQEKTGQAWNGVAEDSLETNRQFNSLGIMENGEYFDDQTDNYTQTYYQLFFNHKFNDHWNAQIALFLTRGLGYYKEYKLGESFADYNYAPFISNGGDTSLYTNMIRKLWLDNYYYGGTFSTIYTKKKTKIYLGGSLTQYDGQHYGDVVWSAYGFPYNYRWYELDAKKQDATFYTKLQQELGSNLFVFADVQYRHVNYAMNGFRDNPNLNPTVQYDFLNPKVGLSYLIYHGNRAISKIYTSFAIANKEPNRNDFEASSNELPKPEELYDAELGYAYKGHKLNVGLNLYYMYYKNQLILTGKINDVGSYTRQNAAASFRSGAELIIGYQATKWLNIQGNATYSINKINNFTEYIDDYDTGVQLENYYKQSDIAFSPNLIAYGQIEFEPFASKWEKHQLYIDIIGKHVGRQFLDNTSNVERSINPYSLAYAKIRYHITTQKFIKEIAFNLSLNNLFSTEYVANGYTFSYQYGGEMTTENFYYPQATFNFIFGIQLKF